MPPEKETITKKDTEKFPPYWDRRYMKRVENLSRPDYQINYEIYRDRDNQSHVLLPVIPGSDPDQWLQPYA
jgi:hypothetical protein